MMAGEFSGSTRSSRQLLALWLIWGSWSAFLGASVAAMIAAVIYGRLPITAVARGFLTPSPITAILLGVFAWWMFFGGRLLRTERGAGVLLLLLPAAPVILGTTLPLLAIYLSDIANHYFYFGAVHLNQPKSLVAILILLLGAALLQMVSLDIARGASLASAVKKATLRCQEPFVLVLFSAMGALQAASYLAPLGMDFLRYWAIADAVITNSPYPDMLNSEDLYVSAGMSDRIVDLPLYSLLLAGSFRLFGHNDAAAYMPLVAANTFLPPLTYLLARKLVSSRPLAVSMASLVVLFPLLRFYTLNWVVPDSIFLTAVIASAWLLVRLANGCTPAWETLVLGLSTAAIALARPEGIAYAGIYLLAALWMAKGWRRRLSLAVAFGLPVGIFAAIMMTAFGFPWPRSLAGTMRLESIAGNMPVLVADEFLLSAIRLSTEQLAAGWGLLLGLALIGSMPVLRKHRYLPVLLAPVWINLAAVYMVDPRVSGAGKWFDFFRHVSYVFPLLVMAAGVSSFHFLGLLRGRRLRAAGLVMLNGAVFGLVLWSAACLTRPSWNFGSDAVNLLSQERVNLVDLFQQPLELPLLTLERVGGHSQPRFPSEFISQYPDQVLDHYRGIDAVQSMSGTSYQTGSLWVYLAALAIACASAILGRRPAPRADGRPAGRRLQGAP